MSTSLSPSLYFYLQRIFLSFKIGIFGMPYVMLNIELKVEPVCIE